MSECVCGQGIKNTGTPTCMDIFGTMNRPWFAKRVNNAGVKNNIDLTGGVYDQAFFEALVNETDNSSRWFPIPAVENYDWNPTDSENETTSNGNIYKLRNGVIEVMFEVYDVPASYYKKFKSMICPEMVFVFTDVDSNLVGDASEALTNDILKGIPIQKGSMDVKYFPKKDAGRAKMTVKFNIPHYFEVGNLNFIEASAMTYDVNELNGLIDVIPTIVGTPTTTGFVVDLAIDFGTAIGNSEFEGAVVGDFTLAEVTPTPGAITITSVTESTTVDGRYTFVIPTQTSADVLRLSLAKTGFEMTPLTVTIP